MSLLRHHQLLMSTAGPPLPPSFPLPDGAVFVTDPSQWEWTQTDGTSYATSFSTPIFDGTLYSGGFVADRIQGETTSSSLRLQSIGTWAVGLPAGTIYVLFQRQQSGTGIANSPFQTYASIKASLPSENWALTPPQANSGTYTRERSGAYPLNSEQFRFVIQLPSLGSQIKVSKLNVFVYYVPN